MIIILAILCLCYVRMHFQQRDQPGGEIAFVHARSELPPHQIAFCSAPPPVPYTTDDDQTPDGSPPPPVQAYYPDSTAPNQPQAYRVVHAPINLTPGYKFF
ncbi:unnamed protein product [Nippostrongylus brasiliensis]|uniref:Secreted protein n=1 Tax=Nippostrongylus brasiliensis TaxID=27835 RepID=A0A0N4XUZ2_NIPBR|nr:unnamed protein product [Nippostrongylus brasiliensis]